jgi:hypothetical protein
MKQLTSVFALFAACSLTAVQASHDGITVFHAQETTLDLFGTVSVGQETIDRLSSNRIQKDGRLGAGVGLNHFVTRNFGFGLDAYSENTNDEFVDNASANLIFRIPLDAVHLAPYAYGGGGYQFEATDRGFLQAGAGLEFRFTEKVGIFADARYVFTRDAANFGMGRAGVRFVF